MKIRLIVVAVCLGASVYSFAAPPERAPDELAAIMKAAFADFKALTTGDFHVFILRESGVERYQCASDSVGSVSCSDLRALVTAQSPAASGKTVIVYAQGQSAPSNGNDDGTLVVAVSAGLAAGRLEAAAGDKKMEISTKIFPDLPALAKQLSLDPGQRILLVQVVEGKIAAGAAAPKGKRWRIAPAADM